LGEGPSAARGPSAPWPRAAATPLTEGGAWKRRGPEARGRMAPQGKEVRVGKGRPAGMGGGGSEGGDAEGRRERAVK